jgi:hypothetical protein
MVSGVVAGAVQAAVPAPPFTEQVQAQGARVLVDNCGAGRRNRYSLSGSNTTAIRTPETDSRA